MAWVPKGPCWLGDSASMHLGRVLCPPGLVVGQQGGQEVSLGSGPQVPVKVVGAPAITAPKPC